ncbi:ABC-type Zn2+ transport system, periplasmic component/surface adhesin [Solemya velum gill symbiont]|uniref:ABC-type Zn2+ transport system, periplasmic component/surface adhesin n=1 Tax=Solemya velum gill symbiont TaxID=2340 RepID=A0A0B0HAY0_SOVGS|nr:SCO family protein [Solemya velum gill symbiont]KHF24601.1 ABC-type Zn2+ transport system, periplasmic component/surface adhesin [Solemya velum gill symbiont]
MRKQLLNINVQLLFLLLVLFTNSSLAASPPHVIASIKPIHSILAGIMQGVGKPDLLVDGATLPWQYEPGMMQQFEIDKADLVVWTGEELEPKLNELLSHKENGQVVEVLALQALKVLPSRGEPEKRDAFFWLDTRNMLILQDILTRELIALDPSNSSSYQRNREKMLKRLIQVDRELEFGYREVSDVPVFLYQDTQQYFEQVYAMKSDGSVASPPAAPGNLAANILKLNSWLSSRKSDYCLFSEAGMEKAHLGMLTTVSDVEPIEIDSLGMKIRPGSDLYIQLIQSNFETIASCVRKLKPESQQKSADLLPDIPDARRFPEKISPRYLLMNHYGEMVSNQDFLGKYQLVYFGYTFCPDICPTSMNVISAVLKHLGEEGAAHVQPIFISVDPKRDSIEKLKEYVAYFSPQIIALTGNAEAIRRIAENFKAFYEKVPSLSGDPAYYTMDHTSSIYLLGPGGNFITKFPFGMSAITIAEKLQNIMGE